MIIKYFVKCYQKLIIVMPMYRVVVQRYHEKETRENYIEKDQRHYE